MKDFIEIYPTKGNPITINKKYIVKIEPGKKEGTDIFLDITVNPDNQPYYHLADDYDMFKSHF